MNVFAEIIAVVKARTRLFEHDNQETVDKVFQ